MQADIFQTLSEVVASGDQAKVFQALRGELIERKQYPQLFEAILLQKRADLGLPLTEVSSWNELKENVRKSYEDGYIEAAREVGGRYLADGDIVAAWPYFRTIGETAPVRDALDKIEPSEDEDQDKLIEIAFHEQANPRKGFELILENYGTCNSITTLEGYQGNEGRNDCVKLLLHRLRSDLMANLKAVIEEVEKKPPEADSIEQLVTDRDWLFEENNYHIDTSHLASGVRFSMELEEEEYLRYAIDLTTYGQRLSSLFQYEGNPPFENVYSDYGIFFRALVGDDEQAAVDHFKGKLGSYDSPEGNYAAAQVLVSLLARIGRNNEAIEISLAQLADANLNDTSLYCPSVVQLCKSAGQFTRLEQEARSREDLVSFALARLELKNGGEAAQRS